MRTRLSTIVIIFTGASFICSCIACYFARRDKSADTICKEQAMAVKSEPTKY